MPEKRHKSGFRGPSPDVGKATQFKPGNNANPHGRPKKIITDRAIALLLARDGELAGRIAKEMVERALKNTEDRKVLLDRVEGKARPSEEESEALKTQRTFVIAMPKRAAK